MIKERSKRSKIWLIPLQEFKTTVQKSFTISQILKHFGFSTSGGNIRVAKQRCKSTGIDTSHIKFGSDNRKGAKQPNQRKFPIASVLVENCSYGRHLLKQRLIKENIKDYVCRDCGNMGEWNGKLLSLQLEHINGVKNDNRVENLCFLCPNCHAQTDTFSGKNLRRKKKPL